MLNVQNKFENFELENKLTSLIQRLMEPHIHNFYKNQTLITEMSQKYKAQVNEVSTLKENLEPKYNELKQKLQFLEDKLQDNFKLCITQAQEKQQQISQIKNQIQEYSILNKQAEKQYIESKRELEDVKANNTLFKSSIEQVVNKLNENNNLQLQELKKSQMDIDQSQRKLISQISNQENKLLVESMKINEIKEELSKISLKIKQDFTLDKMTLKSQLQQEEIKNIKIKLQDQDKICNRMNSIEIYLLYYQQYHVQRQINDALFICQPVQFFYKYASFEKQKLDEFDKYILNMNNDISIQELMNQQKDIVKNATKRFQKVSETVKNMENNDQDSNLEDQKGEDQKIVNHKEIQNQQIKKRKQSANLVYFEEQLRQLREYFDLQMEEKSNQIDSLKQKIKQLSDELYLSQIQFQASLEQNIEKQSINQKLSITNLQESLYEVQNEFQRSDYKKLNEEINLLKKFQQNMIKLSSNMLCLLKQDEQDKEGLKLLGAKDIQIDSALSIMNSQINLGNKKNSIILNTDCISCSGSPIQLFQFFKVACLGYNPSDVEVDGIYFKRTEIIQQCLNIVQTCEKKNRDLRPIKQRQIRQFDQRSKSIQASPRFFSTENRTKLAKYSQMKIFQ
ncbi:unnamed protein product (macronuclear) [Paramecium tetraurelia]|uniref:Uncharacterized protein n=1 Tax=Paramecium tetraurelia TaxID=5888 RepID=A0BK70_PARTE|nr:uncharacterized protein GSPATT00029567001 [Paramecium tetraurelia]CAK58937.1 unnamed protein product [Paramecium tetraurelia]|eukprot:XP_001426335.1 hypothetical protein (macronuclear) [Paramecium tetraurelia strain d4-2]